MVAARSALRTSVSPTSTAWYQASAKRRASSAWRTPDSATATTSGGMAPASCRARALAVGATLVGVNQRDLRTFDVDHRRALDLAGAIPVGVVAVAESGVRHAEDARRLAQAGYQAVLVGETLVRSTDRKATIAGFRAAAVGARPVVRAGAASSAG